MLHADLASYIYTFSYFGIFLWFAIGEQLTPIPEEIYLISVGYITVHMSLNPFLVGVAALLGLLVTDNFLFYISMKGNKLSDKLLDKINSKLLVRIKENLKTNPVKTLVAMGLLPKLRFLSPIISGVSGISWNIFLLVNSIVTAFYVTVYMLLGIFFHNQLTVLLHKLSLMQHAIFVMCMIALAVFIIFAIRKYVIKEKTA